MTRAELTCVCGRRHVIDATPPAPAPSERPLISQRTSEASIGVPRRTFLEALPAFAASGGEVLKLGKLRLVDREAFIGWLRSMSAPLAAANDPAAAFAAELGLSVVG